MLAKLVLHLESQGDIGYYQSSNLQGVLMQQIDSQYAAKMHEQGLNPYSQYLVGKEDKNWVITALSQEAYEHIIIPLYDTKFCSFLLEKKEIFVTIKDKELITKPRQELLDIFYGDTTKRCVTLRFLTPTAFKSNNHYVIIPEVRYIYQSLMNKYSATSDDLDMFDMDTLEELSARSYISQYRLKSVHFPLEGVRVPAFIGELTIRITGNDTLARYANMLFAFGEYSGIGIKTSMGMGAMTIERGKYDD